MAKYAISEEGVKSLNQLANALLINANNIVEKNQILEHVVTSLYDNLGIYGDEITNIIKKNRQTLNANREDIISLAQRVKQQSEEVESLVTMGLGETTSVSGAKEMSIRTQNDNNTTSIEFSRTDYRTASGLYQTIRKVLVKKNVDYRKIECSGRNRSNEEIVASLGGRDNTKGSCSSLALAYAGNKAGYNVLDFRGGNSQDIFSDRATISSIANLPGVKSRIVSGIDDIDCADMLLADLQQGKEYYLATGEHAAIVRLHNGHYEYLELQRPTDNGWKLLHDSRLAERFKGKINKLSRESYLIDIESLSNCNEFLDLLGYINTSGNNQMKGASGHVR